ncbi:RPL36A-HNRNPH2 protein isoform b, partial [Daubentonia madagascariensis]
PHHNPTEPSLPSRAQQSP